MAGTEFEIATLSSLALASALLVFTNRYHLDQKSAQNIHMIVSLVNALTLSFQVERMHVVRFLLAVVGIPVAIYVFGYVFDRRSVGGGGAHGQHNKSL